MDIPCELIIKQTWLEMSCELKTRTSRSLSMQAAIMDDEGFARGLTWYYVNAPKSATGESMHVHFGVTHANMDGNHMECEYFNRSKDRDTYGSIDLIRAV